MEALQRLVMFVYCVCVCVCVCVVLFAVLMIVCVCVIADGRRVEMASRSGRVLYNPYSRYACEKVD